MAVFNFSKLINIFMPCSFHQNDVTYIVKTLLEPAFSHGTVVNENGEPYDIKPIYAQEWCDGTKDVYPNIKMAVSTNFSDNQHVWDFYSIISEEINAASLDNFFDGLLAAAKSDENMNPRILALIQDAYDREEHDELFRLCYLHAMCANNKVREKTRKRGPTIAERYASVVGHRPDLMTIPDDASSYELPYVKELLSVYSEKERVKIVSVAALGSYPESAEHLEKQRKNYYAAETIRVGIRDTELRGTDAFGDFKQEVEDFVVPISKRTYSSGEERLNTVMDESAKASYGCGLARLTDWIRIPEKQGVCHILVNEGKIKWVDDDE